MRATRATARTLSAALVALAATASACTGSDDAAVQSTAAATVDVDRVPAETTTVPEGPETVVAPIVVGEPSFVPGAVVPAAAQRPWLLVGTGRDAPGAPSRLALLSSPDGSTWSPVDAPVADHSSATAAVVRADGVVLVAGALDGADGRHPAVWRFADGALSEPDVVDTAVGRVRAVATDAAGEPVLLLATDAGPAVAARTGGTWVVTTLPGGGEAVGLGVTATTVVVTGSSIWRSVDGARTFETSSAPAVLGAVVGTPGGLVAASCATGGLAVSGDGSVWTDVAALHPRGVVPSPEGGCGTIALDDEGGAWLASTAGDPFVFRVRDQLVDRLGVPSRPPGTIFEGDPLVAAAAGVVVVAVPQPGGVATAVAPSVALTTELELDVSMPASTGAPPGHARPVTLVPLDAAGRAVGVATYPVVSDEADGSYRWTTTVAGWRLDRAGAFVVDDDAAPLGPDGALGGIVRAGTVDVSVATVVDAEVPPGYGGPLGDVVSSRRGVDGVWSILDVVAGGPGRQAVSAVVAAGRTVVAVGEQVTVDAAGTTTVAPLVLAGDGRTFRALPVGSGALSFTSACPGPDGTVVAVGVDTATGAAVVAQIDAAADAVALAPGPPGAPVIGCAGDGDRLLFATPRGLVASTDAVTFEPLDGVTAGDTVTAVASGPAGFAVTGTTATDDGFVLQGPSPSELRRVAAPILAGPGEHEPTGLVVRSADVVVLGLADGAPAAWPVPLR